ncbi:MAG: sugar-binding protein [Lachnospiraceae bacterium]|nr:sugar-binding protein [Lachnospiraceae bacterium]
MKKKFLGVMLSVAMVASLLAGCGDKTEEPAPDNNQNESDANNSEDSNSEADNNEADSNENASGGGKIGVAMPTKDLQRWNQDGTNMEKELKEAGYEVDLQYASNDVSTQVSQIENMISNGCKVLVVASIEGDSLGTVMDQAKEAGIPVIAYDRLIMNSEAVTYYATFDNYMVGQKQGEYIRDALDLDNAGDKTYNIEFVTGDPGDNNVNFFFGGAMDVLKPYLDAGTLVCPSGQTEQAEVATVNWDTGTAQSRFENILSSFYSNGEKLDAVLASNDSTALGVANALASSYEGDYPVLTGQDCDIASVKNMIDGKQSMSIFKDTRTLASKVVEMVDAIMKGGEPEVNDKETYDNGDHVVPSYLCEPVFADINNYQELLIDSGYYTEDDLK